MLTKTNGVNPVEHTGSTQNSVDYPLTSVYKTREYDKFKPLHGNRTKNPAHVKRLMASFEKNPLVSIIIVNEKFEVIDGQHRLEVAKELGLPLHYVIIKSYGLKEVQIFNSNNAVWNKRAYLESYCQLGLMPYLKFREFAQMFPDFPINLCGQLLTGRQRVNGKDSKENFHTKDFEEGRLVILDWNKAVKYGRRIMDFQNHYKRGFTRKAFTTALIRCFDNKNYNHERMMKNLNKKLAPKLGDLANHHLYMSVLEEIYNYACSNKVSLKYNG